MRMQAPKRMLGGQRTRALNLGPHAAADPSGCRAPAQGMARGCDVWIPRA